MCEGAVYEAAPVFLQFIFGGGLSEPSIRMI